MMRLRVCILAVLTALLTCRASASWYSAMYNQSKDWLLSFGGTNGMGRADGPRLSELMEPASLAIDEATDLVNDGTTDEAVEKYREALRLLERLEVENPERAATPEFQSVRNKRAYVDAQLNAILLEEARVNAKAVSVTDTTELEEKLRRKRAAAQERESAEETKPGEAKPSAPKLESELDEYMKEARERDKKIGRAAAVAKFERENEAEIKKLLAADPGSRRARIMRAGLELHRKNYGNARKDLDELLAKRPDDISALNMLAAVEAATGNYRAAEGALAKAIRADEGDYHAYYNLAKMLYRRGDEERAKRFYANGRRAGGPPDPLFEETEDDE